LLLIRCLFTHDVLDANIFIDAFYAAMRCRAATQARDAAARWRFTFSLTLRHAMPPLFIFILFTSHRSLFTPAPDAMIFRFADHARA